MRLHQASRRCYRMEDKSMLVGKGRLPVLVSVLLLASLCTPFPCASLSQERTAEEGQVRAILDTFFRALQKKDIERLMALWSHNSKQAASARETFIESFSKVGDIELKKVAVKKLEFDGNTATAQVAVEINATDSKTGKPAAGFGNLKRTLSLVKDDRDWRVSEYQPSARALALAIVAAKTGADQNALVDSNEYLIDIEFGQALLQQGRLLMDQRQYSRARDILLLARSVAGRVESKALLARALGNLGVISQAQGNYAEALE